MPVVDLRKLVKRMSDHDAYQREMDERVDSIRRVQVVPDDAGYGDNWFCSNCHAQRLGTSARPAFMCKRCDLIACVQCYRYDLKVCKKCVG